ncbi:hypothetical protein [Streptomyces antimycoticus]|uniref:hypothetical protein n=1 Tax=Streptomyces antimycoticus TaxID=68175 RepID=UPI0033F990AC
MSAAASVFVGLAMTAALTVAVWPRRAPTAGARAVLIALIGASALVTLAAIAAPYIH